MLAEREGVPPTSTAGPRTRLQLVALTNAVQRIATAQLASAGASALAYDRELSRASEGRRLSGGTLMTMTSRRP